MFIPFPLWQTIFHRRLSFSTLFQYFIKFLFSFFFFFFIYSLLFPFHSPKMPLHPLRLGSQQSANPPPLNVFAFELTSARTKTKVKFLPTHQEGNTNGRCAECERCFSTLTECRADRLCVVVSRPNQKFYLKLACRTCKPICHKSKRHLVIVDAPKTQILFACISDDCSFVGTAQPSAIFNGHSLYFGSNRMKLSG